MLRRRPGETGAAPLARSRQGAGRLSSPFDVGLMDHHRNRGLRRGSASDTSVYARSAINASARPWISISGALTRQTVSTQSGGRPDSPCSAPTQEPTVVAVLSQSRPIITVTGIARGSPRAKRNPASEMGTCSAKKLEM